MDQCICSYCHTAIDKDKAIWIGNADLPEAPPRWCLCPKCDAHAEKHGDGG